MQYAEETASLLAKQLLDGATAETTIAAVSAPSVFVAMKNLLVRLPCGFALVPSPNHPKIREILDMV